MPIPDYQSIMLPLLKFSSDKNEHAYQDAVAALSKEFELTEQEKKDLLPSGQQAIFDNRVGWAKTYLLKAELLESSKRAHFNITKKGLDLLRETPSIKKIDVKLLSSRYPSFVEFQKNKKTIPPSPHNGNTPRLTPEETIENQFQLLTDQLSQEILDKIRACPPVFFEKLVVELLLAMGYGGSRKDAGNAIGGSGDGGVDGVIYEDRLGLEKIYIQAKRWEGSVGRPELQKFAGALQGQRARKGVFITTSSFSNDATAFAANIETRIILINGERLAKLMIDFNVGVERKSLYEIKKIDNDYFESE